MEILEGALAGGVKVLPGEVAFKLHDTYGFPLDLSADVCREKDLDVDSDGFHAAMEQQKAKGRAAGKFKMDKALEYTGAGNTFVGYEQLTNASKIVALYADGVSVAELKHGQSRGGGAGLHTLLRRERRPGGRPGRHLLRRGPV
jgi:alanyl-tRNA synthetase